ncbi:glycosyltransferase family 4 protein [Leifsonia sp. YIM 134122]|uniref:Glycosyltransferase family 4 protein n=1 Tax=Leifsonia stereocauli TaxID=3134136 RepID=A0ABU9W4G1_9MICO
MLKKVLRTGAGAFARGSDAVAAGATGLSSLLRIGPRTYLAQRKLYADLAQEAAGRSDTFANGVTTALTEARAFGWHRTHSHPTVLALIGVETGADSVDWIRTLHSTVRCHVLVSPAQAQRLSGLDPALFTVCDFLDAHASADLVGILDHVQRYWRRCDVVIIDLAEARVTATQIVRLQHAAYEYHPDGEVGFATPAHRVDGSIVAGIEYDRRSSRWTAATGQAVDVGQNLIPRYALAAVAHGFYVTSSAVDRVATPRREIASLPIDDQVAALIASGWRANVRTLVFPAVVLDVAVFPLPSDSDDRRAWLEGRIVDGTDGRRRVIFVLNATSISGGIRAVFEIANGLAARGLDVAIWSLEGEPTWFELQVPVRSFRSYEDLMLSLRNEDAVKVATWWETADVVWLASVNRGIPVNFVQEFETWFYPDNAVARAAVVASYRHEMVTITEARYQQQELAGIGVVAELIPHGFNPEVFHPLPDVERRSDTVLAVGRSFFQKNFAMTLAAWKSLGDRRPRLLLFGTEPDLVDDQRADYVERPSDAGVNELYNTATVFVQTSRHEGYCLPILEAMAAGCPVITTDSHGNRDFCVADENCIMVGQDDAAGLAEAIERLLADPAEQERLRAAGLETAARFTWPIILDRVRSFYDSLSPSDGRDA